MGGSPAPEPILTAAFIAALGTMTDIPSNIPPDSPLTRPADGYWRQSRRPLVSLVFIAPLLVVYEIGILALGADATRNGVDVWLRTLLEWIGFGQYFLLPVLTVCILLAWQYTSREPWRVSAGVLYGMAVECVLLAICLRLILQLQSVLLEIAPAGAGLSLSAMLDGPVMFLGAGIYEELLFRLILLTATIWALRHCGMKRELAVVVAVLITSLLFSARPLRRSLRRIVRDVRFPVPLRGRRVLLRPVRQSRLRDRRGHARRIRHPGRSVAVSGCRLRVDTPPDCVRGVALCDFAFVTGAGSLVICTAGTAGRTAREHGLRICQEPIRALRRRRRKRPLLFSPDEAIMGVC